MASLWLDVRYAFRMMARTPGLTSVLVLTLALGIGATTTIFSVVSSVLLRPLPYAAPEQLVRMYSEIEGHGAPQQLGMLRKSYLDVRASCRSCAAVGGWRTSSAALSGGDRPTRVETTYTDAPLWPLLGVRPVLGRWFDAADDAPGDPQVIALGFDLWQRGFGGDPTVVGRTVQLDGKAVTVVGVMPRGFRFPERTEVWMPASKAFIRDDGGSFNLSAVIRLAPGASVASLAAELEPMARAWTVDINKMAAQVGLAPFTVRAVVRPLLDDLVGSLSTTLWLLQGAVAFVLLISIVNVANLLLARSETRTREVAVRHALGASRGRLLRQFLTESVILGLIGGGLGILVAMWSLDGVTALIPRAAPRASEIALDARAVAFAVACALFAALLFGLAPILHARRTDLHGALKDGSPRTTGSRARLRVRRALVIGELALAVVLVVGCTVMVRSFLALQRVELGFAPDHVLTFGVALPDRAYPRARAVDFWHQLEDRLRALPGVRAVTSLSGLPPTRAVEANGIAFPGRSASADGEPDWITDFVQAGDEGMIDALGAHVVAGRGFVASDVEQAPLVALVNQAFATKFFRGRDPIGQKVKLLGGTTAEMTVVGVVGDIKQAGIDRPAGAEIFLSVWQMPALFGPSVNLSEAYLVVRTSGDPASLVPAVQRALAAIDPTVPMFEVATLDDLMWQAVARPRFLMFLLSSFAGIALLLAAVGIYGVMSHTVAQRTHEIGVRIALGARPAQVRAMVLRQAMALVAAGVGAGLIAAVAMSIALGASLGGVFYGASLAQPLLYAAVAVGVVAAALIATWIPARRATMVQPTIALRSE